MFFSSHAFELGTFWPPKGVPATVPHVRCRLEARVGSRKRADESPMRAVEFDKENTVAQRELSGTWVDATEVYSERDPPSQPLLLY